MLKEFLIKNGLEEKEAALYLCALEYGEIPVSRLAQKLSIKRTTLYLTVEKLRTKGVLSVNKKRGVSYIAVIDPQAILRDFTSVNNKTIELCKNKLEEIERMNDAFEALKEASTLHPQIRFFDGRDGIKQVLREFAGSKISAVGFTDYRPMPDDLAKFIQAEIIPERKRNKNKARFIVPNNSINKQAKKEDGKRYAEHKIMNFKENESPIELLLYENNKIAFISFLKAELFALVIESESIHKSIKNIFDFMWEGETDSKE